MFELRIPFTVDSVLTGSAAEKAGLAVGDSLLSVNGKRMFFRDQFVAAFRASAGDTLRLGVLRDSAGVTVARSLVLEVPEDGVIGTVSMTDILAYYPLTVRHYTFWESIPNGFKRAGEQIGSYIKQLKLIVNPQTEAYKSVGSVVSMGKFFPTTWDWLRFWNITALFSIMLAVLNILPIPALDGGHVVLLLYEVITRRKPSDKFVMGAQTVGMILLLLLLLLTLGNDIIRLIFNRF
ncbi:MAG: site-2 protease family protein [Rikenellaceae bacterium]|nr:site-2 protease family protein [Rikenellaceae bacterium]